MPVLRNSAHRCIGGGVRVPHCLRPMPYCVRHLPHWQPRDATIFVTWRLHGSLPAHKRVDRETLQSGKAFVRWDRALDAFTSGPRWLNDGEIARMVCDALREGEQSGRLYDLLAFTVMPNHVHALLQPRVELSKITRTIKGFTAFQANGVLGRRGQPFWQDESFDRWIRDATELHKTIRYIDENPVTAGLAAKAADWPWGSRTGILACPLK
jgi:putative transposase